MRTRIALALITAVALGPGCGDGKTTSKGEAEEAACSPIGPGGGTEVAVTLAEWSVTPSPASAPGGTVTFKAGNAGKENHELVVVKAGSPDALPLKDGQVDEDALPPGAFVGEVEAFPPGETCPGTFDLTPGSYVLFCNIVEKEPDGTLESHYQQGMRSAFTVG
jgi:uncharacterized cupredoxin-like copper-binding protein